MGASSSSSSDDYSVGVYGSNAYRYYISEDNNINYWLKKYHDESKTINCVAIGRCNRFVVTCNDNAYHVFGPERLLTKLKTLHNASKIKDIRHIAFGPGDTWVITMKNGYCYWYCHYYPSGPYEALSRRDGEIKYVSMNHTKEHWIVGYGNNGYESRGLNTVHKSLDGVLDGVTSSSKTLQLVEIGEKSYYVRHSSGQCFAISEGANSYIKSCSEAMKSVSLY